MTERVDHDVSWLTDVPPAEVKRVMDALYRVHRLVLVITDRDTLLGSIMEESKEVASAEACSLMLYDDAAEELYFHLVLGDKTEQQVLKQQVRLKLNQGIAGIAAAERKSVNVEDAAHDSRVYRTADQLTQFETRSLLAVPLLDHETLIGVLEVVNKIGGGPFTALDQRVMEMFTSSVATVLTSARLIEENMRSERLAAVGQAVAGLSHYTKNIITGMLGSIEIIDMGLDSENLGVLKKGWGVLKRSVERMSGVVEDMLAFSKPRKPMYETCDMQELLRDVGQALKTMLMRKEAEVAIDLEGVDGPVMVDPRGIYRCVLNLASNAADAVPEKGGKIVIRARTSDAAGLEIEVADNGPGVPEEQHSSIFDPFFSTKGSRGTGLGLAVTQKVVAEHHGTITVEPNPGGGALFRITLPQENQRA